MRKGQRSRSTRDRDDTAEHFAIKPKATDSAGDRRQNDALRRLQLSPSDPRWQMEPPYGWRKTTGVQYEILTGGTRPKPALCWYCALPVFDASNSLYSDRLNMLCHVECHGDGDTIAQKRATVDST